MLSILYDYLKTVIPRNELVNKMTRLHNYIIKTRMKGPPEWHIGLRNWGEKKGVKYKKQQQKGQKQQLQNQMILF